MNSWRSNPSENRFRGAQWTNRQNTNGSRLSGQSFVPPTRTNQGYGRRSPTQNQRQDQNLRSPRQPVLLRGCHHCGGMECHSDFNTQAPRPRPYTMSCVWSDRLLFFGINRTERTLALPVHSQCRIQLLRHSNPPTHLRETSCVARGRATGPRHSLPAVRRLATLRCNRGMYFDITGTITITPTNSLFLGGRGDP